MSSGAAANLRARGIDARLRARPAFRRGIDDLREAYLFGMTDKVMQFLPFPREARGHSCIGSIVGCK
jgi:hypothetical protein